MKKNFLNRWLFLLAFIPALVFAGSSVITPNSKLYSDAVRADPASADAATVQGKLGEIVSVKDRGAVGDGVTNDRTAIQAAITYAATLGNARVVFPPAVAYKLNSGISIDTNKVSVDFGGNQLDFSGMASGVAITIINSSGDANVRNYLNHVHSISRGILIGPGVATTAVTAIDITDSGALNTLSGLIFEELSFVNFAKDVNLGAGAFNTTFRKCNFTILSGTPSTYSINIPTATNSGERNVFEDCVWNNRNYVFSQANVNADTYFDHCSFDGANRIMTVTGGRVYITDSHIESNATDTDYWFYATGTNTGIQIKGGETAVGVARTSFPVFYSDSTCTQMGIVIKDHGYFPASTHAAYLVGGTGRTDVNGLIQFASATKPAISAHQNTLAYGGFESANYTAEWTLAGSSPAVRSNAQSRTGIWSLSFPGAVGNTPSAYALIPVKPGQTLNGEYWYLVPAITGTGGTFYTQIDFLDKGGNVISNAYGIALTTTNVAAWTQLHLGLAPAPAGAVNVKVFFNLFGTTSGTPTAYIDGVNFVVH